MKIAMVGQKGMPATWGGVERHVHELSVRLVKFGHNVTVYARKWYSNHGLGEIEGVKIKFVPCIRTKHLDTITHTFFATIDAIKNKADLIHYHGVGPCLLAWMARIFSPRTKVIATFHSMDRKHEKWNWFAKLMLRLGEWSACRFAHKTIAVSDTLALYCRDVYDREAICLPNGVPDYKRTEKTDLLAKWNLKPQKYVIMLSRLIPHKGAHLLISAFKILQKTQPELVADLKLAIVGGGYYTDDYVKYLKKLADNDKNIVFTGFQTGEALTQLISHARFMVHPSKNEGTPFTVLEGMSHGLAVLLSDLPEHKKLVSNREFLFACGNVKCLTEKIAVILKKSQSELDNEGRRNKLLTQKEYDWDKIAKKTAEIYSTSQEEEIPCRAAFTR